MKTIEVRCATAGTEGWRCEVDVDDGRTSGRHLVSVATGDAERLAVARETVDVERLVYETIAFLLEREPRSSILPSFDLTVVSGYFPEYESEMAHRLAP
jgi:hypothetical protein